MSEWKPIDELFDFEKGSLQSSKCTPGKYTFVTAAEDWKTHSSYTHDCEALIFAMAASGSLGRTHYIKGRFISSDLCFILTPKQGLRLDLTFYYRLFNFLRSDIVKKTATGTSKLAINQANFGAYKLPYFDYDHQLIFRNKIEKINGISENFSQGLEEQLSFFKQLRQSILREAIEGKLTADWRKKNPKLISGENHASKLLEKIKAEKERLIKEGKIRKEKPLAPITTAEKPFDLPRGWVWCRLGEICRDVATGPFGSMLHKSDYVDDGIPIVNPTHIINGQISSDGRKCISKKTKERLKRYTLVKDDLVIARRGDLSKCAVVQDEQDGWLCGTGSFFIRGLNIDKKYFCLVYTSKKAQTFLIQDSIGQTMDNLNQKLLRKLPIALAPISEQQAIVARVDNLMTMIDELEKQVTERKDKSERLMQSVLREAFESKG